MRLAVFGIGLMVLAGAGCGTERRQHVAKKAPPVTHATARPAKTKPAPVAAPSRCSVRTERALTSARTSYAGFAANGAVAYRTPGGAVVARFGRENVNGYPTYFAVLGKRIGANCRPVWYRVQLPIRPNGAVGWVRASAIELQPVDLRIEVDVSQRRLELFRSGRRVLEATVAVGSAATPTPIGRYYVNQRLVPTDTSGPYGPGAIGISAFSRVLTGWAQGGPVAIHGTNEPWSIGHAVSNGCIRLPNDTLERLFKIVPPGTQVIIHP
jgi:lipoprotein-anchoring transpeptidase ErfK/SrfK